MTRIENKDEALKLFEDAEFVLMSDPRIKWTDYDTVVDMIVLHNKYNNRAYAFNVKRHVARIKMSPVQTTFNYHRPYTESNAFNVSQFINNLELVLVTHKDPNGWSDFGFDNVLEFSGSTMIGDVRNDPSCFEYTIDEFMELLADSEAEEKFAFTAMDYYFADGYYTTFGIYDDDYFSEYNDFKIPLDAEDVESTTKVIYEPHEKLNPRDVEGYIQLNWSEKRIRQKLGINRKAYLEIMKMYKKK